MTESPRLPSRLSIDSGVVLAYFLGERIGTVVRTEIFGSEGKSIYHNRLCIAELFYVLCRRRGEKVATDYTRAYLNAEYSTLADSEVIDMTAGSYKCQRAISLADCYVIAAARVQQASALFARREKDLDKEIKRKPFDVPILFAEDLKSNLWGRESRPLP